MINNLTTGLLHVDYLKVQKVNFSLKHMGVILTKTNTVCCGESENDCSCSLKAVCEEILDSLQRRRSSAYRNICHSLEIYVALPNLFINYFFNQLF